MKATATLPNAQAKAQANTLAAPDGRELPALAAMPATGKAALPGRKRLPEDDTLAAQADGDLAANATNATDAGDVVSDAAAEHPILLAQANTGSVSDAGSGIGAPSAASSTGATASNKPGSAAKEEEGDNKGLYLALGGLVLGGLALAGGGDDGDNPTPTPTPPADTTAPVFTSAATASVAENTPIATTVYTAVATDNVAVTAYSLSGTDAALFNINATTGAVTFKASPNFEAPADAGANNVYDFTVTATDAAGNTSSRSVALTVTDVTETVPDTTAPVFTSAAAASVAENTATATAVYTAAATDNVAVTAYSLSGADAALFNINTTTGAVTFKASPNFETPADAGGNNVYDFSVTASDAAGNAANQAVALTVTDVSESASYTPGQTSINLGTYGNLIAPVQVEGKWYYVWDMNGDLTHSSNQDTGGQWGVDGSVVNTSGSGYQYDYTTHNVLDALFTQDINGNANPGADTTNTYRYATLNGVHLALPTANSGMTYPNGVDAYQPGTTVANGASNNTTYDELLAIWDAHNGTGTGVNMGGTPLNWAASNYWSATPSASGHINVGLFGGYVGNYVDIAYTFVALEVL